MSGLDWTVLFGYVAGLIAMSVWVGRPQATQGDYYLAGRRMGPAMIAMSILATQVSAISLIGAPAFVALRPGGGLVWLQYEFAVPLAMIAVLALLVPAYHAAGVTTIYELLERRFGPAMRRLVSAVFLVSRGLATGTALYAASLVLAVVLDTNLTASMIGMSLVACLYTTIGGIRADIYSDAAQLILLWCGTVVCLVVAFGHLGDAPLWSAIEPDRLRTIDPSANGPFGLAPMVLGGFFLYASYYGCDQSQAQRLLTSPSARGAQWGLWLNGILRFPITVTYCALGVVLAALLAAHPEFAAKVPPEEVNRLVPQFLLDYVPSGVRGLIVAGILAAAMSSFDSAFNSLSAATVRDFIEPWRGRPATLAESRIWTLVWGGLCTAAGMAFSRSQQTVIELVNQVGSLFYGPVLAVFVLAVLSRRATSSGAACGLVLGVLANVLVWQFAPAITWWWWNAIGFVVATGVGQASSLLATRDPRAKGPLGAARSSTAPGRGFPRPALMALVAATGLIVSACLIFELVVR